MPNDSPKPLPIPVPPRPLARLVSVCSDVHLGTRNAKEDDFYSWLATRRADETVVLLGDILDFWIYDKLDKRGDLVNRVVVEWDKLWHELAKLHERGTHLHYVPGNHDVFVFFVETADHFAWSRALMQRSEEFQQLRDKTKSMRMTQLASIHYPFLRLSIGDQEQTPPRQSLLVNPLRNPLAANLFSIKYYKNYFCTLK